MYGIIPVLENPEISEHAWAVWAALCVHARWKLGGRKREPVQSLPDSCYPSLTRLAAVAHVARSTVQRAVQELVEAGYVEVRVRWIQGKEGRARGANGYILYPHGNAPGKRAAVWAAQDEERKRKMMKVGEPEPPE